MNTSSSQRTVRHAIATVLLLSSAALVAPFAGCTSEPSTRMVNTPPPASPPTVAPQQQTIVVPSGQTVTTNNNGPAAATATAPATVIVQQAPPAAPSESMPERPSERHVWVAGYWYWQNDQYFWAPGQWLIPPRTGATWVPPRWQREGGAYRFYDGYWAE